MKRIYQSMRTGILALSAGILLMFSAATVEAAAPNQNDPVALLKYVANNMIAELKANQATLKSKPQTVYRLANQYVVPYADLDIMSRRVLPPAIWNNATQAQRTQFKNEFKTTLIRTYASSLSAYKDQTIKFYPVRGTSANSVVVQSDIVSPGASPIRVAYRLVRANNQWKVYDLSVEGVSMLESFRSQFSDLLSQGDMSQLLERMAGHNQGRH